MKIATQRNQRALQRIMVYLVGIFFVALGIQLTINANLGVGAWDVLVLGSAKVTQLTYGIMSPIIALLLLAVYGLWNRKMIPVTTFISAYLIGGLVDFFNRVHLGLYQEGLLPRILIVIGGTFVIGVGANFVIQSRMGVSAQDLLMLTLVKKRKWSVKRSKFAVESAMCLIGFALGGPVGIGTILITLLIGPFLQLLRNNSKLRWIQEAEDPEMNSGNGRS